MKKQIPPTRRKFAHAWEEIAYLYAKLLYWLYDRGNRRRALPYADRLGPLLDTISPGDQAIRAEECRAMIAEARGDLSGAISHRENEVRLIRRLHEITTDTPSWEVVSRTYDYRDLSDRLDLLAILYHDAGRLDRAIATLQESQALCAKQGLPFAGQDLLENYQEESEAVR